MPDTYEQVIKTLTDAIESDNYSAFKSNLKKIKSLGRDIDAEFTPGTNLLRYCMAHKRLKLIALLLEKKANPNYVYSEHSVKDDVSKTFMQLRDARPLHFACSYGNTTDIVKLLLQAGAKPEEKMQSNFQTNISPLALAAKHGNKEVLEVLLQQKVNVDEQVKNDNVTRTALWYAIEEGDFDKVRLLLAYNADVTLKSGFTERNAFEQAQHNYNDIKLRLNQIYSLPMSVEKKLEYEVDLRSKLAAYTKITALLTLRFRYLALTEKSCNEDLNSFEKSESIFLYDFLKNYLNYSNNKSFPEATSVVKQAASNKEFINKLLTSYQDIIEDLDLRPFLASFIGKEHFYTTQNFYTFFNARVEFDIEEKLEPQVYLAKFTSKTSR